MANTDGVRLNLSRRHDTLMVEAIAALQIETEIEELTQRHEQQTDQTDLHQPGGTFWQTLAWLALGATIGTIILKPLLINKP